MNHTLRRHLAESWHALPAVMRYPVADEQAVQRFEQKYELVPEAFRWFLLECGGGVVGSEWIDGIEQLPRSHQKFRSEQGPDGWQMTEAFVIAWDGAGNPIAIDKNSGSVLTENHDLGGIHTLASSFEQFLESGLRASEA